MRFYKFKIGIIIISLIVIFIALNLTGFSKEVKNFFYTISCPIQKKLWEIGKRTSVFFETITEVQKLKKENEDLKLKIQELMAENSFLKELKKENEFLRMALEIGLEKDFKLVLTRVIGKDIFQDSLIIDKGLEDGIKKGFIAITQQKVLVGRVSEVYENFSKITLISNKETSFDAKVSNTEIYPVRDYGDEEKAPREQISNGVYGMVRGRGDFNFYFDLVPREKEIKEGDVLVTSAIGGIFPEGILVGEIGKIKKSDIEPFQQAEIKPIFDIKKIDFLFIITNY